MLSMDNQKKLKISISIDEDLHQMVVEAAQAERLSVSRMVNKILSMHFSDKKESKNDATNKKK
jgi:hypothetical protein